jgi:phosphoglycerol transferase MdoB-like AlkP superfamily enzyme
MKLKATYYTNAVAVLVNLILAYLVYMITRVAYVWENWSLFRSGWSALSFWDLLCGSLRFDTSAIIYTNVLYIVLMLLPCHGKERNWYQTLSKWIFVVVNSIGMVLNLVDAVYSQYTGRRTTFTFFKEFSHEDNIAGICGVELLHHWYFVLLGLALIVALARLYVKPTGKVDAEYRKRYYFVQSFALLLSIPLSVIGMRGGATTAIRPITISNANQYVNQPAEAAIVLNTPFSIIRTVGKGTFADPGYYTTAQLNTLYSPLHSPAITTFPPTVTKKKNVVILIVESFGREYIGAYNKTLEGGRYHGYTPFVDSLLQHSLTFEHTFANGRKSIDGMPSILSSIPMFVEPFFLTSASLNDVSGLAGLLSKAGYSTAFFHGAENGSMGFQAFARTTGFQHYYGRTEYDADNHFGGEKDFDGTWAIWDEPFLQFYAAKMSEMKEPFMTAVFTASSHHPFVIPEKYKGVFPDGPLKMHKCIRYTDYSLRKFFETASRQKWYKNTIFVLTSDHTNQTNHDEYKTSLGCYSAPILIFDPSGDIPASVRPGVAQQIDIMPTLLAYLGYSAPYVAFGIDLLNTPPEKMWAVNYSNGVYQYVMGDYLLLFDGSREVAFYNYKQDPLQQHNLRGRVPEKEQTMLRNVKALIQSYMQRMTSNQLVAR